MATPAEMDAAALIAEHNLSEKIDNMSGREVLEFWASNYMKSGHKRLGRIFVKLHKEKARPQS